MAQIQITNLSVELTEEIWERLNKESVEVNARADLKASDYEKIKEQMEMDMPRKNKPKKRVAVEQLTPEAVAQKAADESKKKAQAAYALALGSLKRTADKHRDSVKKSKDMAASLKGKGYPKEMAEFFLLQFDPVSDVITKALDDWAAWSKADINSLSEAEIDQARVEQVESCQSGLETKVKTLDGTRRELTKICK